VDFLRYVPEKYFSSVINLREAAVLWSFELVQVVGGDQRPLLRLDQLISTSPLSMMSLMSHRKNS
jgi:hypothetical protein